MGVLAVKLLVERTALAQNGFEDFGRNAPRRKAGRFSRQSLAGTDHGGSSPQSRQSSLPAALVEMMAASTCPRGAAWAARASSRRERAELRRPRADLFLPYEITPRGRCGDR